MRAYVFWTFTAKTNITKRRHEVVYRLFNDPKMLDLEWHWDAILMLKSVLCFDLTGLGLVRVLFGRNYVKAIKIDLRCQQQIVAQELLVFGDIKLKNIFVGCIM